MRGGRPSATGHPIRAPLFRTVAVPRDPGGPQHAGPALGATYRQCLREGPTPFAVVGASPRGRELRRWPTGTMSRGNYLGRPAPHFSPPLLLPELARLPSAHEEWARFCAPLGLRQFRSAILPCPGAPSGSAHAPDSFGSSSAMSPDQCTVALAQRDVFPSSRMPLLLCLAATVTPLFLFWRRRGSNVPQPAIIPVPFSTRFRSTNSLLLSPPAPAGPQSGWTRLGLRVSASSSQLESGAILF
ncbi:hypothetical protein NDU88_011512 [Pleurodeles waltl]|uniref:Uncharacterized protein n=1 Tax=Pleurodeles waltl TaxID=8319 RepID=A0AAV7S5N7_PLEWA|nr:hypothetical protein NDU88_011512 [Pleurodeles waltl]